MKKESIKETLTKDLDEPVPSGYLDMFKKGNLICRIIYEDGSYTDFLKKFDRSYVITIKKREYFVIPECIIKGKKPFIAWYFNNPMPINFKYEQSKLTALQLMSKEKINQLSDEKKRIFGRTIVDAEAVHALINTKLMQGLYAQGGMTVKSLILIMVVVMVFVLIILQITGTVDVVGFFTNPRG